MDQNILIETPRLFLRKITLSDQAELSCILQDIDVMYAWEHAFSAEEVRAWINENILRYQRDGYSYWAVLKKDTGDFVGVCGLIAETADAENHLGIGYLFNKAFWHQGLAFESANACKNYAFSVLNSSELTAQIRPDNLPSIAVVKKLGMTAVKQFNRLYRGKTIPHLLYQCQNNLCTR